MKNRSHTGQKTVQFLLLLICCGLGYLLWKEMVREAPSIPGPQETSQAETAAEPAAIITDVQFPPMSNFDEITTRPLFFDDRQPYVYVEPVVQEQSQKKARPKQNVEPAQFVLNAVIITPKQQFAVIQAGRNQNQQKIARGELMDGWTLEEVNYDSVTLSRDGDTVDVELEVKGSLQKTVQPPPVNTQATPPRMSAADRRKQMEMQRKAQESMPEKMEEIPEIEENFPN